MFSLDNGSGPQTGLQTIVISGVRHRTQTQMGKSSDGAVEHSMILLFRSYRVSLLIKATAVSIALKGYNLVSPPSRSLHYILPLKLWQSSASLSKRKSVDGINVC